MLQKGFWIYVWRVETPNGELLYVGMTGDSSSPNANPPFTRMGQHLGHNEKQNPLRRLLRKRGVGPESCGSFQLVCHGPIFPEQSDMAAHREPRAKVSALEKKLAKALEKAGYDVVNEVRSRQTLDRELWEQVRDAFADHFPKLT